MGSKASARTKEQEMDIAYDELDAAKDAASRHLAASRVGALVNYTPADRTGPRCRLAARIAQMKLLESVAAELKEAGVEVVDFESRDALLASDRLQEFDAVITDVTGRVDAEVIAALPKLRVVCTMSVGFDHIDIALAAERGVRVYSSPGSNADAVAEHAVSSMLALGRCLHIANDAMRDHNWDRDRFMGAGLSGATVGLVGFGRIAQRVARRLAGFEVKLLIYDICYTPEQIENHPELQRPGSCSGKWVTLEDLLRNSDFVSLHVPLLPSTRHLISKEQFALMKPEATLVNTARGGVIDSAALVEALKNDTINAASLDVYSSEPPDYTLTDELLKGNNVLLTQHVAAMTFQAKRNMQNVSLGWFMHENAQISE